MELDSYGIYFYFTGDVRSIPIDHIQKVSIGTNSIKHFYISNADYKILVLYILHIKLKKLKYFLPIFNVVLNIFNLLD
jgi:hypothetical protein